MTSYQIKAPLFTAGIVVSSDLVIQAAPVLHWAIGRQWEDVRTYFQKRGWTIEPTLEESHPDWLEISGQLYELHWQADTLKRVTLYEDGETRDLDYEELPPELKDML